MKKNIDSIKFNLTHDMAKKLIEFNELKKKLINLNKKYKITESDFIEIEKIAKKLNSIKLNFIKEFRLNNKDEILEYLKLKDND